MRSVSKRESTTPRVKRWAFIGGVALATAIVAVTVLLKDNSDIADRMTTPPARCPWTDLGRVHLLQPGCASRLTRCSS